MIYIFNLSSLKEEYTSFAFKIQLLCQQVFINLKCKEKEKPWYPEEILIKISIQFIDILVININVEMSSEPNQSLPNQPIITEDNNFIVKVKLLSNEVYEVSASPNTTIPQLKVLVQAKTSVPVEKQRLVFAGKQLVDTAKVGDYIKQSGLTIHLIARSQPQENANTNPNSQPSIPQQPQTQPQNQQSQQPQQPRPPIPPMVNPFGSIFGFMGNPQVPQQPQQNPNQPQNPFASNINSAVNNLIENLGIRIVPGPVSPPTQQQQPNIPQQPRPNPPQMNQFNIPPGQIRPPQPPQPAQQGAFRAIQQLEQSINRINYPSENLNAPLAPRDRAIAYLRSLQNNMLRFMPQLNRGIQMLQQGRVTHLPQVAEILQNMNQANSVAIQLINRLSNQSQQAQHVHHNHGHNHHHHNHNHPHNHAHNHPVPNQEQRQPNVNPISVEGPTVTATVIISEEIDPNSSSQAQSNPLAQQPNIMGMLNNFMSPGTGFNFANLFGGNMQPQNNQQPQSQSQQSQPEPQQSQPQNNPQQSQSPQSVPNNQQVPQNPLGALGGVNIMSMFNSLQQSGGMGTLLGMSLGGMLEQEGQPTTVYSAILAPITGSEVLACFTQKDFSFLNRKRDQFREATLRAITVAGSRQELVKKYSQDLQKMLAPPGTLRNEQSSRKKIKKILDRHIQKVISLFLDSTQEINLNESVIGEIKLMYCEAIEEIAKNSDSLESVFGNIKQGFIQSVDHLIPGFSGLLYSMIERDMVRIYREYSQQKKRKQEMSEEQAKDEADLLKKIEEEGKNDNEEMASFEHSSFYPKSQKE